MRIEALTDFYGFNQLISEPTHILPQSSSCIDLIFTNQLNMIFKSEVHPTLFPTCHHQIISVEISLKVNYPPLYHRKVWLYEKANYVSINRAISIFDWNKAFSNQSVDNQVQIFNSIILNICSNYIPNKMVVCDDSQPPWMNDHIRAKFEQKNIAYLKFVENGMKENHYQEFVLINHNLCNLIEQSKNDYYTNLGNKLSDNSCNGKKYWTLIKTLFNGKKIPEIPPR